ncbi:BZ3500_MvSof-1268-A1-R1_Chr2-2g05042 [Microbotryum saponariae]|uniref:BZ3500_MvSof-1268-A1-R1_Chr2-2g05042 protein n=1 Tax=Microbotryum saponariae TaxID=289078 RepID=A0A2X0KAN7_9BASI|nr:BZ3500_MvSof-1268-A1-R1_Chr2-2g05042 [Microbotryum saponariae]SDA00767.1 BZ3501_MvSof-1269-A2-R1_Chr2-2g04716 [Microbotryum saponariae]
MVAAAAVVTSTGSSSATTANAPTAAAYLDDDMHNSFFSLGAIPWHTIDLRWAAPRRAALRSRASRSQQRVNSRTFVEMSATQRYGTEGCASWHSRGVPSTATIVTPDKTRSVNSDR